MRRDSGLREHRTGHVCPGCEGEITIAVGSKENELQLHCDCGSVVVLGSISSSFAPAA